MTMKADTKVDFKIQGIKIEQFVIFEQNCKPNKKTGLATNLQFKIDEENKHIGVFLGFEFNQNKKIFLKIIVSCHFKILDDSWASFLNKTTNFITVPKGFLAHLAMITTGTTRGVLFAKTEGTDFSKFIIPTLNVAEMVTEDAKFDVSIQKL